MPRVLVIDDDRELTAMLAEYLTPEGFALDAVHAGDDGLARALATTYDLIILDVMLPGLGGFEVLRRLRAHSSCPVIMLTARGQDVDRIVGLEIGADDYLVKPFSFRELTARIRTVLRRHASPRRAVHRRRIARFEPWTVDLTAFRAQHDEGRVVELTAGELAILAAFLEHPGRVLWRQELLALTHHDDAQVFPRTVDVLIARLRHKLEADLRRPKIIRTVRGEGYRFDPVVRWDLE